MTITADHVVAEDVENLVEEHIAQIDTFNDELHRMVDLKLSNPLTLSQILYLQLLKDLAQNYVKGAS